MSDAADFDVVRDVLDHEIVDVDGLPCGIVDDVLLEGEPGAALRVAALLVGPGAWMARLPEWIAGALKRIVPPRHTRVAWSEVAHVGVRIELAQKASALGLGTADRRLGRWMARIPGGRREAE